MDLQKKIKSEFLGKKILLFGLGLQGGGEGALRFFLKAGTEIRATDLRPQKDFLEILKKIRPRKVKFVFGKHFGPDFKWADIIFKNPAVPQNSPFLKYAKKLKKPVLTEAQVFFSLVPREKIIGVTGTKGKTTITLLLAHILRARFNVRVVGNIPGHSALESLFELKKLPDFFVYELSSFNLEDLKISPKYAIITNIFPDHLNRYKNFGEYKRTKKNISKYQKKGDFFWLGEKNGDLSALAQKIALSFGISAADTKKRIESFEFPSGRAEYLGKIKGARVVNDTTATNPGAALFSIAQVQKRFKTKPRQIILIAGGENKNLKYDEFSRKVKKLKRIILIPGSASDKIRGKNILRADSLDSAVKKALEEAKAGDCILFSPAAASFNMFKNEFERGREFRRAVFGAKMGYYKINA